MKKYTPPIKTAGYISVLGLPLHNATGWVAYMRESRLLTVVGAGSPRSRCQQVWRLLRSLSAARRWPPSHRFIPFSLCVHIAGISSSSYKNFSATGLEPRPYYLI